MKVRYFIDKFQGCRAYHDETTGLTYYQYSHMPTKVQYSGLPIGQLVQQLASMDFREVTKCAFRKFHKVHNLRIVGGL